MNNSYPQIFYNSPFLLKKMNKQNIVSDVPI